MKKKLLLAWALMACMIGMTQECPDLIAPEDGDTDVPVDVTIRWEAVDGIPGYQIRLGTGPGLGDLGQAVVGSATSFTPPTGLPEDTQVFVTIVLDFLFEGGMDIECPSQSFRTEDVTTVPDCVTIRSPLDGAEDVSVFTNILWNNAARATSYDIFISSVTPGAGDIEMALNVQTLSFNPTIELPPDTMIFVRIVARNENGPAINCQDFSFTTGEVTPLPGCTSLISPINGETNVPLTPLLRWETVPNAVRYRVTIGTTPNGTDVLDGAIFDTNETFVLDFNPNQTFFITIIPLNANGDAAIGCGQEIFSTLIGCGPFLDPVTNEFIDLSPDIVLDNVFSFCENADPFVLTAPSGADGYRWYSRDEFDNETLIAEDVEVTITEEGSYFLEAFNLISQPRTTIECPTILDFEVVSSEIATIDNLIVNETALGLTIEVQASGNGDYEYSIDNIDGPYQSSPIFRGVEPGTHTLYVRDRNGCGIVEETFEEDITVEGFPKFFTPNGDFRNEFWQFRQPVEGEFVRFQSIRIFDRFGTFLAEIDQNSLGWDGTFNGRPLPSGGYWFRAVDDSNAEFRGFFTLKR